MSVAPTQQQTMQDQGLPGELALSAVAEAALLQIIACPLSRGLTLPMVLLSSSSLSLFSFLPFLTADFR